ncbi:MAG TPA: protein kinase, partial [Vicinamibacteria bacterium]|nr:protein kinase [Vicinamibacteria bacterium]
MIGRKLAHYRVVEKIGEGAMGEVYRARDEHLERDVAIKVLPPGRIADGAARSRFRKEALALSKLNHPNVQTVHDFDSQDDTDFLVVEYVPGITLDEKVMEGGLSEGEVVEIGEQLAAGLIAAHERGIVHRDLKPANLRLMPDGRLKILDFGLAKLVGQPVESAETMSRFETQTFAGTPHYMAPEQRAGGPADARTDIYSAGMVLRELLTDTSRPVETNVLSVSADLRRVLDKCLDQDPAKRYQSAKELLVELRSRAPRRWASRRAVLLAAGAAVALAVTFLIGLRERGAPPADSSEIQSIVALPSEVVGSDEDAFLADAIPKTVSTYLSQVVGLETKLPPASADIERFGGDIDRIARTYRVSALVLSTVTAQPERLFLNVQLVEANGRRLLWSNEYEGERDGYLELVHHAAEELQRRLRPTAALTSVHGVAASSRAELAFQRGLYYSNRFNNLHHEEDFEQSLSAFEEALSLDPALSDAAAEISWLYEFKLEAGLDPDEAIPRIDRWARRALTIDEDNGRAWAVLSNLEAAQGGGARATVLRSALRAVHGAPMFPRSHIALLIGLPSCRLGLEAGRESARLDPLYTYAPMMSAGELACLGRTEEALTEIDRALAIEPEFPTGLVTRVNLLHTAGRLDEALSVLDKIEPMVDEGRVNPAWFGAIRDVQTVLRASENDGGAAFQRLLQLARGESRFPYWQLFAMPAMDILATNRRIEQSRQMLLS